AVHFDRAWAVAALLAGVAASRSGRKIGAPRRHLYVPCHRLVLFHRRSRPQQHPRFLRPMNNSIEKIVPVFSAAFALIYILSVELNWALFTYHPKIHQWGWLVEPARNGPVMYWYGWLVTSALGASAVSVIAFPLLKSRP